MSAKEKQVVEVQEKLEDITECPICTEMYKDPKILPYIHTFCMICLQETGLKTDKSPGDKMPCPVCRTEFTIPEKGFVGLQRNFFMERLIEMKNILNPSSTLVVCDACQEDNDLGDVAEIPSAEMYCADCNQRLCRECCKNHRKYKATRDHRMLSLDGAQVNIPSIVKPCVCDKHENKSLEIYCFSCQEAICALCLYKSHKTHDTSPVVEVVTDFRKIIQENADSMMKFVLDLKQKTAEKGNDKEMFAEKVADVESEIKRIRQNLQECTEKDYNSLLQQLNSIKQERFKENDNQLCDIEAVLACLESYQAYCKQVTTIGSDVDICRAMQNLNVRAADLKQRYGSISLKPFPNILLKKTEFHDALCQTGNNIIGNIEDSDTVVSRRRTSDEQPEKIDDKLMKNQISLDTSSQSDAGKTKSVDELKLETGDKVNNENVCEEGALTTLKRKVKTMSTTINRLNHNLDIERLHVKELEQERDLLSARTKDYESNEQTMRHRVKDLEEQVALLKGLVYGGGETTKTKGTIKWEKDLTFSTVLETFCDPGLQNSYRVFGIAILGNELFVASNDGVVVIHDLTTLKFKRRWKLPRTGETIDDIKQCNAKKCLYFVKVDSKTYNEIITLDLKGNELAAWSIETAKGQLSVTRESNVLLTVSSLNQLNEYTPDGKLVQVIHLPWNSGIECPSHAIKLTSNHFLVCHGNRSSRLIRVCIVDVTGDVIKSFGEQRGNSRMYNPCYMDIDKAGNVLVLDHLQQRVLLLNPNLECIDCKPTVCGNQCFYQPKKTLIDESNTRVFIVQLNGNNIEQVCVYTI